MTESSVAVTIPVHGTWECIASHSGDDNFLEREISVLDATSQREIAQALAELGKRMTQEADVGHWWPTCMACGAVSELDLWTDDPFPRIMWQESASQSQEI